MALSNKKALIENGKINYTCLMDECLKSCCGPFGGVQKGIDSIYGTEFSEIVLTYEDSSKIISDGFAYLIELMDNEVYRMKLEKDGSCCAFVDGRCSIHSIKPSICRAFPFYIDMFVGLCAVSGSCPGIGAGWLDLEEINPEIEAARNMYSFWISRIDNQK
jgi:Fe-S-cluster containining protein